MGTELDTRSLRVAPDWYRQARDQIDCWLGYPHERKPIIIGIDGADGVGKSSMASWLGWQLEMPVVALDLFIVPELQPLEWRVWELENAISARVARGRPIVVEGIFLLQVLAGIGRTPDRLIWISRESHSGGLFLSANRQVYEQTFQPAEKADLKYHWA